MALQQSFWCASYLQSGDSIGVPHLLIQQFGLFAEISAPQSLCISIEAPLSLPVEQKNNINKLLLVSLSRCSLCECRVYIYKYSRSLLLARLPASDIIYTLAASFIASLRYGISQTNTHPVQATFVLFL